MTSCVRGHFDGFPGGDQFIVGPRILGPSLAFAQGVEAVGELANSLCAGRHLGQQCTGSGFAATLESADQVVQGLPHRGARVVLGRPVSRVFGVAQKTYGAFAGCEYTGPSHAVDTGTLGAGQHVSLTESAFTPAIGL